MPTVLFQFGWRIFFYSNEGNEPIHVHCRKGSTECKFWLDIDGFDIQEAYSVGLSQKDRKIVRKIIFNNFDQIVREWKEFEGRKKR